MAVATANNLTCYAAQPSTLASPFSASDASDARGDKGVLLVLGSEGQGLSDAALQHCAPVSIPMPGDMESLNVAVAGGILMYVMR